MKHLLTACFCLFLLSSQAQNQLHVKSGKTFSTFMFRNSEKTKDETLNHITNNFFGMSYDMHFGKLQVLRPEVSYREAGARSILNSQKLSWKLNYLDINMAYMLKILDFEKIKLYQGVAPGMAVLLAGEQFIGQEYHDLKAEKSIKNIDYGVNFILTSKIKVLENVFLTLEYRYGLGIYQIETNKNQSAQTSRNRFHGVIFGLALPF